MNPRWSEARLAEMAEAVREAAERAGAAILEVYRSAFEVEEKADGSPVTEADFASHRLLDAELRRIDGDVLVLSEESGASAFAERRHAERLWLVDPLDGTREFVQRTGEFAVAVALVEHGQAILGVLAGPVHACSWTAVRGQGAFRVAAGKRSALAVQRPAAAVPRVTVSRNHHSRSVDRYLGAVGAHQRLEIGSALKFTRLAEGAADLYPRLNSRCCEWDIAAGQVLVEAAGGQVVDRQGEALRYNRSDELIVRNMLAFGDPDRPWLEALHVLDA